MRSKHQACETREMNHVLYEPTVVKEISLGRTFPNGVLLDISLCTSCLDGEKISGTRILIQQAPKEMRVNTE